MLTLGRAPVYPQVSIPGPLAAPCQAWEALHSKVLMPHGLGTSLGHRRAPCESKGLSVLKHAGTVLEMKAGHHYCSLAPCSHPWVNIQPEASRLCSKTLFSSPGVRRERQRQPSLPHRGKRKWGGLELGSCVQNPGDEAMAFLVQVIVAVPLPLQPQLLSPQPWALPGWKQQPGFAWL